MYIFFLTSRLVFLGNYRLFAVMNYNFFFTFRTELVTVIGLAAVIRIFSCSLVVVPIINERLGVLEKFSVAWSRL